MKRITLVIHIVKIQIIEGWSPPWPESHPSCVYCVSFQTFISTHFLPYLRSCVYTFIRPSSLVFSSVFLIVCVPCSCYAAYIVSGFPFIYFYILNINTHEQISIFINFCVAFYWLPLVYLLFHWWIIRYVQLFTFTSNVKRILISASLYTCVFLNVDKLIVKYAYFKF